ncbi:MAG: TIGR00730 family Rossman fold protein [Gemmobacter sp.]
MPATRSVCVFCGSRDGSRQEHATAAQALGRLIAAEGWRLVYGAGDVGLMGAVAEAAQAAGGKAIGVVPVHLMGREKARERLDTMIVTENMHERKKVMFMNSDVIVVMPGGAGSLDEFFEVLTWRQIGLHEKPIFLLNIGGFWDPLVGLIDHVIAEGFAEPSLAGFTAVVPDVPTLAERLRAALG